jgi:hypothetical protein
MSLRRLLLALLIMAAPSSAFAEDVRIVGDSIGEGLHLVSNLPSLANRFNVAIYTPFIFQQLKEMPKGATVVMSLGTNDAVGGAAAMDVAKRVDSIVATADAQGVKLYWMGPPCVLKPWETYSRKLDEILAKQLAGTDVTYISAQDPAFCDASLHGGDGVHFGMAGYARLWQKVAGVAGIPVAVASAEPAKTFVHGAKKPARKRHGRHKKAGKPPADAPPAPN